MPQAPQDCLNEIRLTLEIIKRRYRITGDHPARAELLHFFAQPVSGAIFERLQGMLFTFTLAVAEFKDRLTERADTPTPGTDNSFDAHNRQIGVIKDNECSTFASSLYHALFTLVGHMSGKENENTAEQVHLLRNILVVAEVFESLLGGVSDHICRLELRSTAFSFSRYIELIRRDYEEQHRQSAQMSNLFSWSVFYSLYTRKYYIKPSRLQEITFLETINLHADCTDEIRDAAMRVIMNKIMDTESWGSANSSFLMKILQAGCSHSPFFYEFPDCIKKLDDFCRENNLNPPQELHQYLLDVQAMEANSHIP